MEALKDKNINQDGLYEATNDLLELETKKGDPNITKDELEKIEKREQELYELYPMLQD